MAYTLRVSIDEHALNGDRCILFSQEPRLLKAGSLSACKDWLARFMLKLETRRITYAYDDLLLELRVNVTMHAPSGVRRVAYQIKDRPLPTFGKHVGTTE
jgi:hypothetical protein